LLHGRCSHSTDMRTGHHCFVEVRQQPVAIVEGVVAAVDEDVPTADEAVLAVGEDVLIDDEDVHGNHAQALGSATSCQMPRILNLVNRTAQRS